MSVTQWLVFEVTSPVHGSNGSGAPVWSVIAFTLRACITRLFLLEEVVDEEGCGPLRVRRVLRPLRPAQGAPRAGPPSLGVHEADGVGAREAVAVA